MSEAQNPDSPTDSGQAQTASGGWYSGVPTGLDELDNASQPAAGPTEQISWTASEYIAHQKTSSWFIALAVVTVLVSGAVYWLMRDVISVVVIIVAALLFGTYGSRQPRQQQYVLDSRGLVIGDRQYAYSEFRSFGVIPENEFSSIVLMPLKRFAVPTTIYYDLADEQKILSMLSNYLPYQDRGHDPIDSLMRRLRF